MNWDQIRSGWKQFNAALKEKWGQLTNRDNTPVLWQRAELVGVLQQRYDDDKERAETEPDAITHRFASWPLWLT